MLRNEAAFRDGAAGTTGALDEEQETTLAALLLAAEGWGIGWTACLLAAAWQEAQWRPAGICADPALLAVDMHEGSITGKSLRQYILGGRGDETSFRHCRRVVDMTDPAGTADQFSALAVTFRDALLAGRWG